MLKYVGNGFCLAIIAGLVACGGEAETESYESVAENEIVETDAPQATGSTWDNDSFNSTFTSTERFGGWDANGDQMLDENEFNDSFFSTWDDNDDNKLDENEWQTAANDYGVENQNWRDWDANSDNNIDQNEFRAGMANSNYRTEWDRDQDNMINEREYSDGIFSLWDGNNDNTLDEKEYNENYSRYYGS
ncbi:hypothetical protein GCM10028895_16460 [Pontibacter rugosus]